MASAQVADLGIPERRASECRMCAIMGRAYGSGTET